MVEENDIRVGVLTRPHGVDGGVRCRLDHPELPKVETPVTVRIGYSRSFTSEAKLIRCSPLGARAMLCLFEGAESREKIETFIDKALYIPSEAVTYGDPLGTPELIGYQVVDEEGEEWGEIEGIIKTAAHSVWEVDHDGYTWMLPAVEEFVRAIDQEEKVVEVRLIPGLYDPPEVEGEEDE